MASFNNVVFGGNIAGDAEIRDAGNSKVIEFRMAVNNPRPRDGVDEVLWIRVSYFTSSDGILQFLKKGRTVVVSGTLTQSRYQAKDGSGERTSLDVRANDVQLFGGDGDGGGGSGQRTGGSTRQSFNRNARTTANSSRDDVPF